MAKLLEEYELKIKCDNTQFCDVLDNIQLKLEHIVSLVRLLKREGIKVKNINKIIMNKITIEEKQGDENEFIYSKSKQKANKETN